MKIQEILDWLDGTLSPGSYDDVSNNGLQIARDGDFVKLVAFGVDASAAFLRDAARAGAQLCVVHHGVSWGGGIRRITGNEYAVVAQAMKFNLAMYASHLPLDANESVGNNHRIAKALGLKDVTPAFSYHGNVIGVVGNACRGFTERMEREFGPEAAAAAAGARRIGVCSGGAGEFAPAAKELGCDLYLTGEASWGDVVAAENVGMKMLRLGHYATETYGVRALAEKMRRELGVETIFIDRKGA